MNWKIKKKIHRYSFIVKITKWSPLKAYKYSESIYHLSESKVPPHSPLHFLMPLSFPRPEKVRVSQCCHCPCCPWGHCSHIPLTLPWAEPPRAALAGGQRRRCCVAVSSDSTAQRCRERWAGRHSSGQLRGRNHELCHVRLCWSPPQALYEKEQQGLA